MFVTLLFGLFATPLVFAQNASDCIYPQESNGNQCVDNSSITCSGSTPYIYKNTCYENCPDSTYVYKSECVDSCPTGTLQEYSRCVKECSPYTFRNETECVSYCDTGHGYNGTCVASCPLHTPIDLHGKCVEKCPEHYALNSFGSCYCTGVWLEGTCTSSQTPMPSRYTEVSKIPQRSSTQTMTALPSRRPSQSASLTRTPKPSDRPGSSTSTASASRTPRPSAAIFADISRKPLPSIRPLPPPPVEKSPAPSRWPRKTDFILAPEEKPAYIDAKITVQGGNKTEIAKPERIQEMQASLACTLRMPLENIRIINITFVDADAKRSRVDIDPTKFMMAGDGSTDCYDMKKPMQPQRRLRALLQEQGGAIEIDYAVIAPSDDILSMDVSQMQEVLSTSPIMVQVVASVGGSKLIASVPVASFVQASPTASAAPTPSGWLMNIEAIIGGGIAGFAVLGMFVTLGIFYVKEKKRATRLLKEKEKEELIAKAATAAGAKEVQSVMIVVQGEQQHMRMNPIQTGLSTLRAVNLARFDAVSETSRRSAQPLKKTHTTEWTTRSGTGV